MLDPHDKEIYKRTYNRPNERWVCGRAALGEPCPHGPSRSGKCVVGHACKPAQIGDRWVCTRPEQYGGPCDSPALDKPTFGPMVRDGIGVCCTPVHCTPTRSLRALRGRVSIILCMVLVGAILTALGGRWRNTILSPGPLTINHQGASMASLEQLDHGTLTPAAQRGDAEESCHICHTSLDGGLQGLLASAVMKTPPIAQSAQCLKCHQEDVGEMALFAHALAPDLLAEHTAKAIAEPFEASKPFPLVLASFSPGVGQGAEGALACAVCHQEHNGAFNDLKRMGNGKCQACHVKVFKGIDRGHPEFSTMDSLAGYDYPYRRRTRIIYDHERHETNYFKKEENLAMVPADCRACHEIESEQFTTRLKPFEQMCASCHTGNIVSARDEWTHVFGFPSLESDVYEILEDELDMAAIPRSAGKSMSPFMTLLLEGFNAQDNGSQESFATDLAMLQEFEGDLSGIAYDEDPEIVGRILTGLQQLQGAAMNEDQGGLRRTVKDQLERLSGLPLESRQLDAMFGFPKADATADSVMDAVARKDVVETSGWLVKESGFRLDGASWTAALNDVAAYQALKQAGDGADSGAYAAFLEVFENYAAFRTWFDAHCRIVGEEWVDPATGDPIKNGDWKKLVLALGDPGSAGAAEDTEGDPPAEDEEAPADAEPSAQADTGGSDQNALGEAFVAWFSKLSDVKKWVAATVDTSGEYWLLRAPRSLYYRPIQHADPFTTAWLDYTATLYNKSPAAAMVFDDLSGRASGSGVGACMKCHSIDAEKDGSGNPVIKVNWKSTRPARDFVRFSHRPHLKLMNCAECHRAPWVPAVQARVTLATATATAASAEEEASPDSETPTTESTPQDVVGATPERTYLDSFKANDEGLELGVNFSSMGHGAATHAIVSNFEPIAKDDCTRCHVADKAGDSCLICHNYHIRPQNMTMGVTSLRELIMEKAPVTAESVPES